MARGQSARLDQKKLLADPILVTTIIVLIVFLTLFILYPLAILLVDAVVGESGPTLSVFQRVLAMPSFETAISNTLVLGLFVGGSEERRVGKGGRLWWMSRGAAGR